MHQHNFERFPTQNFASSVKISIEHVIPSPSCKEMWFGCLFMDSKSPLFTYFSVNRLPISLSTVISFYHASKKPKVWSFLCNPPCVLIGSKTVYATLRPVRIEKVRPVTWPNRLMFGQLVHQSLCLYSKRIKQPRGSVFFRRVRAIVESNIQKPIGT